MATSVDIWHSGNKELIWDRFCWHFYFTVPGFMSFQQELLIEQLGLLCNCELGKKLLKGNTPRTLEEFRSQVPLTTYTSYDPYLPQRMESALPEKPYLWMRASGPGGTRKSVPVTKKMYELMMDSVLELFIIATASTEGDFSLVPGDAILNATPPLPWFAGTAVRGAAEHFGFRLIPPTDESFDRSTIGEKSHRAFQMALHSGLDVMMGVSSVLARMGEQFTLQWPSLKYTADPISASRLVSGRLKIMTARRDLMPKDLWRIKAVVGGGADTALFGEKVKHYWGVDLFEIFPITEFASWMATPTWGRNHFTFQPYFGFLEFIPETEVILNRQNPSVQVTTVLLDQLKPGEVYEIVFTSFRGGAFVRYRTGDLIQITTLEDGKTGIRLPHFIIKGRADKLINLGAFARINERFIWLALDRAQIACKDWFARKEVENGFPALHIYLDADNHNEPGSVKKRLNESMSNLDRDYMNIEKMLGCDPLRLTLLPYGTIPRWRQEMIKSGRDAAWANDQRMQAPDEVIDKLLEISRKA